MAGGNGSIDPGGDTGRADDVCAHRHHEGFEPPGALLHKHPRPPPGELTEAAFYIAPRLEIAMRCGSSSLASPRKLGNRSALEWILDQYKEKTPKDPTIREKFNAYRFADHKERVIDLLMRVTRMSVETMEIVEAMKKEKR